MNERIEVYKPTFKSVAGRSLMSYTFTNEDSIIHYQSEMLVNNQIRGLLKSDSLRINGQFHLQYDITSLIPIKKLFERKKLHRKDFILFVRKILELLENLEQYLLDGGGVVFDSTYVFADPQEFKLEFAYLPTKDMPQDLNSLKEFLLDIIINDIRFIDEPSDNYVQKLIEVLKTKDFTTSVLKEYLSSMNYENTTSQVNKEDDFLSPVKTEKNQVSTPFSIASLESSDKATDTIKATKICYPIKSYILFYSIVGTLFIFFVTLIMSGIISPNNPDALVSFFGFILICGAVIYLAYSKFFTADKRIEQIDKKVVKGCQSKCEQYVNKAFSVPIMASINAKIEASPAKSSNSTVSSIEKPANFEAKTFYDSKKTNQLHDRTILLEVGSLKLPHLKRIHGNSSETIILKGFPFMLGRLDEQVDYSIRNPAVGKLHAEIIKVDDGYYLNDMNSRNGTFINGERIEAGKESLLQNEDRVTLGNEEFIFYCGN